MRTLRRSSDLPSIFEGIAPTDSCAGILRLTETATRRSNREPEWSLCELRPSEDDYRWMLEWAAEVKGRDMRPWLDSYDTELINDQIYSREAMVGLLLLLFASETARRFASEGAIWAYVSRRFLGTAKLQLFVNGQPTDQHKLAVQHAVRRYRLRNVFEESEKAWMITAYLQFGFSSKSIRSRLPSWIAGLALPESVQHLMGPRGSDSFKHLWIALQRIRSESKRGNEAPQASKDVVAQSPWLMGIDREAVLTAARKSAAIQLEPASAEFETGYQQFLGKPQLQWDGVGAPVFSIPIFHLDEIEPDITELDILINNRLTKRLTRSAIGWPKDQAVTTGLVFAEVSIQFKAPDADDTLLDTLVELWDPKAEAVVFDARGRKQARIRHFA